MQHILHFATVKMYNNALQNEQVTLPVVLTVRRYFEHSSLSLLPMYEVSVSISARY